MKDSELETQLRSLRPVEPSLTLEQRIATELAQPAPAPTAGVAHTRETGWAGWLFPRLAWAASGAVAAIVFTQAMPREDASPQSDGNGSASTAPLVVQETSEVLNMNNEGLTVDAEHGVARIVRLTSIQRRSWVDATGAEITTEKPREEFVLVPVTYQ
jgi:negative regulator of sigma E activity